MPTHVTSVSDNDEV